jgi:hypothetical protein
VLDVFIHPRNPLRAVTLTLPLIGAFDSIWPGIRFYAEQ